MASPIPTFTIGTSAMACPGDVAPLPSTLWSQKELPEDSRCPVAGRVLVTTRLVSSLNWLGANVMGVIFLWRSCRSMGLMRAVLKSANLERAILRDADLSRVDLEFANLKNADLSDASLRGAALGGANLTGVTIAGTDFFAADLVSARLVAPIGLEAAKNFDKAQNVQRLLRE